MFLKKIMLCAVCWLPLTVLASGGTWLDATRIIYHQGDSARGVRITSTSDSIPYLVRAWVTPVDGSEADKNWVVTPPVYRLNEKGSLQFKIASLNTEHLPKDRESVFYFNALSIPGTVSGEKKEDGSLAGKLVIAINAKIKLFYRPDALRDADMTAVYRQLQVRRDGKNVLLVNPTPFHLNFSEIKVNGVSYKIPNQMVAPHSTVTVATTSTPVTMTYRLINDHGGETASTQIRLRG